LFADTLIVRKKMIVDFHTHIFPKMIREERDHFFPMEPAFQALYESPKSKMAGAEEMVRAMDDEGVEKSVVFGFPWKRPETVTLHNNYVIESVRRFPDRLIGFCCLGPSGEMGFKEVRRCLDAGLSGVGELAFYESGIGEKDLESLAPVMQLCRERNRPVLIHTNEPVGHFYAGKTPITLLQLYRLAERFPDNRIVFAHWGGGLFFYHLLKREAKKVLANVYVDTAASPFLYDPDIYRHAVEIIGEEKILFGSDYPLIRPGRYVQEITDSGISPEQARKILGLNALDVLFPDNR
jgi:predicted TIM-barrel fold metal-dependent hydrolase